MLTEGVGDVLSVPEEMISAQASTTGGSGLTSQGTVFPAGTTARAPTDASPFGTEPGEQLLRRQAVECCRGGVDSAVEVAHDRPP